jgi:glycosyltransferase involved in cell wall biosynthesis
MTDTISVVVTSYNYEAFIEKTLSSIAAQTLPAWETIVVDDGSTDDSLAIISRFCETRPKFKLLRHAEGRNRGLSESLQLGIRHATGKWIAFCESDDWWEPAFLQELSSRAHCDPKCGVVFSDVILAGTSETMEAHCAIVREHFRQGGLAPELYRQLRNAVPTMSCAMVQAELIRACNFEARFPPSLDMWLWAQLAAKTHFEFVDVPLCHWRQHEASYMKKEVNPATLDISKVHELHAEIRRIFPARGRYRRHWSACIGDLQHALRRLRMLALGR